MIKVAVIIYETDESLIDKYITELKHIPFNFEINIARSIHSFLDYLKNGDPYLVLMSSRISGFGEVLLGLRQKHPISAPLIIIGELEREQDFRVSTKNGAYDYIALENIYRLTNSAKNAIEYELIRKKISAS